MYEWIKYIVFEKKKKYWNFLIRMEKPTQKIFHILILRILSIYI